MALEGFGNRLQAMRRDRGYTQKQLATSLGVTEQAVSKWERGTSYPDIMMLNGLSEVLQCSLDYLFQFEADRKNVLNQDSIERKEEINRYLLPDIVCLMFGEELVPLFVQESRQGFPHMNELRKQMALEWGVIIPAIRVMDELTLAPDEYRICVNGRSVYQGKLSGIDDEEFQTVFAACREQILVNIHRIINNQTIYYMVENLRKKYPYVVEGIVPERISYSLLREIVIHLIQDYQCPVNPLILIIELVELYGDITDAKKLAAKMADVLKA